MTKKDKELLFRDLSARLPYHTHVKVWLKDGTMEEGALDLEHNYGDVLRDAFYYNEIVKIKPYLFPLSSMTSEQLFEVQEIMGKNEIEIEDGFFNIIDSSRNTITYLEILAVLEWFYKNHFDINGLIEKGLAIDATGLNIYWLILSKFDDYEIRFRKAMDG